MTPAARIAAAIEVLDRWLDGTAAEKALTGWARGARYAGSKDRAAVRDHVYDALRCKGNAAMLGGGETGRSVMSGLLRLQGIAPETLFTGEGHAPAPLSSAEASVSGAAFDPWRDIPDWLHVPLRDSLGHRADDVVACLQARAPLYLRVNQRKATAEDVADRLARDGIETIKTDLSSALEVVEGRRKLHQSIVYTDGLVEIQDLSVQLACAGIDWPGTGRILDYCAGGGGKTLAIADHTRAMLFAHDANPKRMTDLAERAARAGVAYTSVTTEDVPRHAPYDLVLCDVPCSGSGTWRRDPEAKWRLTPESLADLGRQQQDIIAQAQGLVGHGGRVIYMTCSMLEAENGGVVATAVAGSDWQVLQERRYGPLDASDGFYVAELQNGASER